MSTAGLPQMVPQRIKTYPPAEDSPPGVYIGRKFRRDPSGFLWDSGPAHYEGGLHQLLIGPSGVGKGMRLQAPNLLSVFGKSMVIIDPKGQLAAISAHYRQWRGDEVHIVDPFGVMQGWFEQRPDLYWPLAQAGLLRSSGFNPLAGLARLPGGRLYDAVRSITQAAIPLDSTAEPFWPLASRALLTGITMHEVLSKGARANLVNAYRLLTTPDQTIILPDGQSYELNFSTAVQAILNSEGRREDKEQTDADREYQKALGAVISLLGQFSSNKANETLDSIRKNTEAFTEWLNSGPIGDDMQQSRIDLSRLKWGERPVTIYAVLPSDMLEDHSIWLRLFVSSIIRACIEPGRGRDILMMIDEFPALGYMETIERQWGVARDYGLSFWVAIQNFSQLSLTYQKYETMLSSTGLIQSFRTGDPTTSETISKLGGNQTVVKRGYNLGLNTSEGAKSSTNQGNSKEQIALPWIPEHHLRGMAPDRTIVAFGGHSRISAMYTPHLYVDPIMAELAERALANPYRPHT